MKSLITIDGYEFPMPSEYTGTTSTIVDSARNAQGYAIGAVIREDLAKVQLKWNFLTPQDWSNILKCFNSKYGGNFYRDVEFFNEVSNSFETRKMYVGDRTAPMFKFDDAGQLIGYTNVSLSLIEV